MDRKYLMVTGLIVLVLVGLFGAGCGKIKPGTAEVRRPEVAQVVVSPVREEAVEDFYETAGTVRARATGSIASKVTGTVVTVHFRQGEPVRAGQLLVTIAADEMAKKVAAAEAAYQEAVKAQAASAENRRLADITYRRYAQLVQDGAISRQDFDRVAAQKKVADFDYERAQAAAVRAAAALEEAKVYQGFTRVTAPFDGIAREKKVEEGSTVVPGTQLAVIEDAAEFEVDAGVDERYASFVHPGMKVFVTVPAAGRQLDGTVKEVVPAVDVKSRNFLVRVSVPGEGLKSGLYAKVRLAVGDRKTYLVPRTAVVEKGQLTGVYVVGNDNVIRYRLVKTGKDYGQQVEILTGLAAGDQVVVSDVDRALDGAVAKEVVVR
ncbi:efflux transporter, RND family, MFP subunit [Thermosinus carboxydivorans Nor1]|uniref:Efflux transporter, RND family, MFP subunit n=1 Tax=Thermosinus carboxydivorans Nor1 TaxID=401526 RepID=A1HMN7_9FIRM|nr:efflux RND transporter periplasmic adaptor subunit [Thermosinus carboxydivorans]EAX48526.1 efflux transporter, RND family, MFP subunit [Thermosinus carboxydivorans Nor1]